MKDKKLDLSNWKDCQEKEMGFWRQFGNRRMCLLAHSDFFELIYRCFCKFFHKKTFKKALEIGIGASGGFLSVIPTIYKKYAVDTLIDKLRKEDLLPFKSKIKYQQDNAENLSYKDNLFDLVIVSNTLDHCENMEKTMEEIKRVLNPRGYLLFMTYLNVLDPHPYTFKSLRQIKKFINLPVMEEHLIDDNHRYRGRNDYCVVIFQNLK